MRRAVAALSIALVLAAGCGRATMATGAALTFTGMVGVGMGAALGPSSCEEGCFGPDPAAFGIVMGGKAILIGLLLIGSGAFINHAEQKQAAATAAPVPQTTMFPPPPPQVPEAPPPPPRWTVVGTSRESGTWRDVPPVPGDDAP
jgi:hypothetical protein